MGLYKKSRSPYWWMSYSADGEQVWESTKTTSKAAAAQIWKQREAELALGKFKVGWPGKRIEFKEICEEFERSHFAAISEGTIKGLSGISQAYECILRGVCADGYHN